MVTSKVESGNCQVNSPKGVSNSKKRRLRRKKLQSAISGKKTEIVPKSEPVNQPSKVCIKSVPRNIVPQDLTNNNKLIGNDHKAIGSKDKTKMSSKGNPEKSRDEVLAAREAKKLAKQKTKTKDAVNDTKKPALENAAVNETPVKVESQKETVTKTEETQQKKLGDKSKDEVDRAVVNESVGDKDRDNIKAERAAKKAAKLAKKKGAAEGDSTKQLVENIAPAKQEATQTTTVQETKDTDGNNMTVKDLVETLKDIVNVAKEVKEVTAKVQNIDLGSKKPEEVGKSKAELRAERRAKQEAQRAAKQTAIEQTPKAKPDVSAKPDIEPKVKEIKPVKAKVVEKPKAKSQTAHRISWFQHSYTEHDKESLRKIAINSNLHPAIVKLGVQLASRVVKGSNARCIALLDALDKMVRDYTVPAKTEFARGLEAYLAKSLDYLWSMRQPSASQTNAVKFFRHHIMKLPNNVDESNAKKTLRSEIEKYITEQIDKAGEAISIAVRNKISEGDTILTYGCSSLIERILVEAWQANVKFRTIVVGNRVQPAGAEMLRRLTSKGLLCTYVDYTALNYVMKTTRLVVVGASALLADGCVRGASGTAGVALAARAHNVPVLVAAETHKFSERVQTDAFLDNELGDPDDLIDKTDEYSPLKDWRSNPNLTPLNLTYDITPPSLVTAVVTELAILPCTSAPVVLRFKLSEYGM